MHGRRVAIVTIGLALTLVGGGCTRVGFHGAGSDSGADLAAAVAETVADTSVDAPGAELVAVADLAPDGAVDPLAPFGAPQPVAELNTLGGEDDPALTSDMLEIFFDRDGDIFRAARDRESDPWLSPDLRTIYFASTRTDGNQQDIFVARR